LLAAQFVDRQACLVCCLSHHPPHSGLWRGWHAPPSRTGPNGSIRDPPAFAVAAGAVCADVRRWSSRPAPAGRLRAVAGWRVFCPFSCRPLRLLCGCRSATKAAALSLEWHVVARTCFSGVQTAWEGCCVACRCLLVPPFSFFCYRPRGQGTTFPLLPHPLVDFIPTPHPLQPRNHGERSAPPPQRSRGGGGQLFGATKVVRCARTGALASATPPPVSASRARGAAIDRRWAMAAATPPFFCFRDAAVR